MLTIHKEKKLHRVLHKENRMNLTQKLVLLVGASGFMTVCLLVMVLSITGKPIFGG